MDAARGAQESHSEQIEEWPWTGFLRKSHMRTFDGFELYVYPQHSRSAEQQIFAKLEEALILVFQLQPWNKQRLRRDIPKLLTVYPTGAEYVQSLRCCVIGYEDLLRNEREEIAAAIVHEATHGRICSAGIHYTSECRERIERACVRAETNLLRSVNGQRRLLRTEMAPLTPWWTEEQRVAHLTAQLRQLGAPELLIRSAVFIRKIKRRWPLR